MFFTGENSYVGFKIIFENTPSRKITMVSAKPFMILKKRTNPKVRSVGHCLEAVAGVALYNVTKPSK